LQTFFPTCFDSSFHLFIFLTTWPTFSSLFIFKTNKNN